MSTLEAVLATKSPRLRRTSIEGRPALELPWGEELTVPRWAPGSVVTCAITAPRLFAAVAPLTGPMTGPAMRVAAPVLRRVIQRLPEGPSESARQRTTTRVAATASAGARATSVSVDIRDVYGFTALALVEGALRISGAGAMTPAQAFDPAEFLDAMRGPLLSWTHP